MPVSFRSSPLTTGGASQRSSGAGPGLGDSVTEYVDYANFKTSPPAGCPDNSPILGVAKTATGIPNPGDTVTYTLVLTNSGLGSPMRAEVTRCQPR